MTNLTPVTITIQNWITINRKQSDHDVDQTRVMRVPGGMIIDVAAWESGQYGTALVFIPCTLDEYRNFVQGYKFE